MKTCQGRLREVLHNKLSPTHVGWSSPGRKRAYGMGNSNLADIGLGVRFVKRKQRQEEREGQGTAGK